MISRPPNPEAPSQPEMIKSQEGPPIEGRFQSMRERFTTISQRLRGSLHVLQRDNPRINLDAEITEIDGKEKDLVSLDEVTARRLGIDFKATVDAVRGNVAQTVDRARGATIIPIKERINQELDERVRKPQLIKQFAEAGFADPKKAVAVVEYLEQNTKGGEYSHGKYDVLPYRYKREDIENIRRLTNGIEDPVRLFEKLSTVIRVRDKLSIPQFAQYIELIKDNPRLNDVFAKLSEIGSLEHMDVSDVKFSAENPFETNYRTSGIEAPDSFRQLLDMPQQDYDRLFSSENVARFKKLNQALIDKRGSHDPSITIVAVPDLLAIGSDPALQELYSEWSEADFRTSFNHDTVTQSIFYFRELTRRVPELVEMHRNAFDVARSLRENYSRSYYHFDIDSLVASQPVKLYRATLADPDLCQKAQILAQHGFKAPFGSDLEYTNQKSEHGRLHSLYFIREADQAALSKTLDVYDYLQEHNSDVLDFAANEQNNATTSKEKKLAGVYRLLDDGFQDISTHDAARTLVLWKELAEQDVRAFHPINMHWGNERVSFIRYITANPEAVGSVKKFLEVNHRENRFYEGEVAKWFTQKGAEDNSFLLTDYVDSEGRATPKLIDKLLEEQRVFDEDPILNPRPYLNLPSALNVVLSEETIAQMNPQDRAFWEIYKKCVDQPNINIQTQNYLLDKREYIIANTSQFSVDGKANLAFCEELACNNLFLVLDALLTEETLAVFPNAERQFWTFLKNQPSDLQQFLVRKAGDGDFSGLYAEYIKDDVFDARRIQREFLSEVLLLPERIGTWETLTQVFGELHSITDREQRAMAFLRIAEALRNAPLTQRTEVEAIQGLREAYAGLYRSDMGGLEKTAWNLLRKELPLTTDQQLMGEMRNQAVVVEQNDQENLSWVHEAVHNYVRVTTPDYIRTLRVWLEAGETEHFAKLRELSEYYPPEAQVPIGIEGKRDQLQGALESVRQLEEISSLFYEVRPEKLRSAIRDMMSRDPSLLQDMNGLADILERETAQGGNYAEFLLKGPRVREKLLSGSYGRDANILVADSVISDLFKKGLPVYLDTFIRPKIADGSLSRTEAMEFMQIFHNTLFSGMLEGENQTLANDIGVFRDVASSDSLSPTSVHKARLMLELVKHGINTEWGRFMSIAQPEMLAMLERMSIPHDEAISRVYGTDLIEFRKNSYSFYLEDLMDSVSPVLLSLERAVESGQNEHEVLHYREVVGSEIVEKPGGIDEKIATYILDRASAMRSSGTLGEIHTTLSDLSSVPEAQAEKLCRLLVEGYVNKESLERNVTTIQEGENTIVFYPYTLYGVDAVVITLNDEIVPDPLSFLKEHYRGRIVPAMEHSMREGD